jgi:hypothetical protein
MSLINFKNFVGPLGNKVQLGALAIVIIIVLVLRLNSPGSGASDTRLKSSRSEQGDILNALSDTRSARRAKANQAKDEFLDGLVADGLEEDLAPPAKPQESESFDDIRKTLGLD